MEITPFLWFDGRVREAVDFYTSVFGDSAVLDVTHYPEGTPYPAGEVMIAVFELAGQRFMALNGGPQYSFTPAISFMVSVDSQAELDALWSRLTDGGAEAPCGWLTDRFGLSWQIIPRRLGELMSDPDAARAGRVAAALMGMVKIDIAALESAHVGADD
jgi:predicted 3-demethylubiquinone-9 3-methyltransferase (glyoxalase superfamily)